MAAIDWVTRQPRPHGAVINMSLGGGLNKPLNDAVEIAVEAGVHVVVSAGNRNRDACKQSPASAGNAITVGATGQDDARAYFSNYGRCLDIFAPGVGIESTTTRNGYYERHSGTSMSAPHVAGVAALLLQEDPTLTPAQLTALMLSDSTRGLVTSRQVGSPNLLLNTRAINERALGDSASFPPASSATLAPSASPTTSPSVAPRSQSQECIQTSPDLLAGKVAIAAHSTCVSYDSEAFATNGNLNDRVTGSNCGNSQVLAYDLAVPKTVSRFTYTTCKPPGFTNGSVKDFTLSASASIDGTYEDVLAGTIPEQALEGGKGEEFCFVLPQAVTKQFWKFNALNNHGNGAYIWTCEIELFEGASAATPTTDLEFVLGDW
jgi:hypothetical protein